MKALTTTAFVAAVAAIVLAVILFQDAKARKKDADALSQQVTSLTESVENLQKRLSAPPVQQPSASSALSADAKSQPGGGGKTPGGANSGESPDKKKKEDENPLASFGKALGEMMKSDSAKDYMKETTKSVIEALNKDLFELLGLDPEKKKALTDILALQQQEGQALGMQVLNLSNMSESERQELIDKLRKNQETTDAKVKDLLGDEGKFAQYKSFQDSAPERQQLSVLKGTMEGKGAAMSDDQEQRLMDLLYKERKAVPWKNNYADQQDIRPEKFSDTAIADYYEQQKAYDRAIDQKVTGILTPEQVEIFNTQRTQQRAMEKMGMNFAKALFTPKKE
jgi:hypothetical protein